MNHLRKLFVWLALYIIFLEIFFQVGGTIFRFGRELEYTTKPSGYGKNYTILCLGDSVTAYGGVSSWPSQLELMLNTNLKKRHYIVLNEAVATKGIQYILLHINENLKKFNPDMVIIMAGIVDRPEPSAAHPFKSISQWSKVYLLIEDLLKKLNLDEKSFVSRHEMNFWRRTPVKNDNETIDAFINTMAAKVESDPSSLNYTYFANLLRVCHKDDQSFQYALKAFQLEPKNYLALRLMIDYLLKAPEPDHKRIFRLLLSYLEICPLSDTGDVLWTYSTLNSEYYLLSPNEKLMYSNLMASIYLNAITAFPRSKGPYEYLTTILFEQKKYLQASYVLMKQLHYFQDHMVFDKLIDCYIKMGDLPSAENLLKHYVQYFPPTRSMAYLLLFNQLLASGDTKKAETVLEQILEVDHSHFAVPQSSLKAYHDLFRSLDKLYRLNGEAQLYNSLKHDLDRLNMADSDLYAKILRIIVEQNDTPLIFVQYPMVSLEELKEKIPASKNLYFVDNESSFQNAVNREDYYSYFVDYIGGNFGHCNDKGYHLLAENVYNVITKEVGLK